MFKDKGIELVLFTPNHTDDESTDNDCSEDESVEDGESSHSSQEEAEE